MINIKKLIFIIFLFISFLCFTEDKISIGVSSPFMRTQEVSTIFYQKQFIFELLSDYNSEKYLIQISNVEISDNEGDYLGNCKIETRKSNYDYLLYSVVYVLKSNIYFKVVLINPYNDNVIFTKLFSGKNDFSVNEFLTDSTKEIIKYIDAKELTKIKNKKTNEKESDKKENNLEAKTDFKHEIFIMNGFFKNTPFIMSLNSWYIGYAFTPFKFFNIEASIFWGSGYYEDYFDLKNRFFEDFYIGGYGAFHFFVPGNIVEPNLGVRFDLGYLVNKDGFFSIPFDFGLKIFVTKNDWVRLSSSFQYIYYDFNTNIWENNFIIGFMIGYARKI